MAKQRPMKLRQASAYYRVAAKFDKAGQYSEGSRYRQIADRLVRENHREAAVRQQQREERERREAARRASRAARLAEEATMEI